MLALIGGTGLYKLDGLTEIKSHKIDTPFGAPSGEIQIGKLCGVEIAFLPRHGTQHQILPSEINYRANIWALKKIGVTNIISVSATGSLREEIAPGDLASPSQYIDLTKGIRKGTFFGEGIVGHISTAEPTCENLSGQILNAAKKLDIKLHRKKTYACVEGPRLGTRAESHFMRQAGCDLVGMTNVPEVFLAREAQICYSTIAISTDYDCWLDDPSQHATVEKVMELYKKNMGRVQSLLLKVVESLVLKKDCQCRSALKYSLLTDLTNVSEEKKKIFNVLMQ
jgi:5'-methylthioadenosine phosphorylase